MWKKEGLISELPGHCRHPQNFGHVCHMPNSVQGEIKSTHGR